MDRDNRESNSRYGGGYSDYSREFENNYRRNYHPHQDDSDRFSSYRNRDYEMENDYYHNVRGERHTLDDIRQGYGYSSFSSSPDRYDEGRRMERERNAQRQQGYGSGRLGGYSGSGYGGANYSAHGSFGGSSNYGSMSGGRGNADDYVSSSGYGGGYDRSNRYSRNDQGDHTSSRGRQGTGANNRYSEDTGYWDSNRENYGSYETMSGGNFKGRSIHDEGHTPETRYRRRTSNWHQNW